ncbi:MAG: response regulator [Candidatus Cloacimonadota bacterium]|nr:MAG: response regulator [Candidatus Cloacimonadota bacterium]
MTKKYKILIVDDDPDFVLAHRIILEANGYDVVEASNGAEGLQKTREEKPDLIILDVSMDMKDDGFYVSHDIKRDPDISHIPILMVTAIHDKTRLRFDPETDGEYLPVEEFIEKPIEPDVLIEKIKEYLK